MRRVALLTVVMVAGLLAWETWRVLTPAPGTRERSIMVHIPPQESVFSIAARLQEVGVVRSSLGFAGLSVVRGTWRSLKAGEYEVPRRASTLDVLVLLESGRMLPRSIVHPEGATITELARVLERAGLASAADVLRLARDPAFLRAHEIEAPSVEGYLFPDTYHFVPGMGTDQILGRMIQRMHVKLRPDLRERARARHLTVHELLTLASIIEREAVARDELRLISAVFWNRLQLGMPLQADPTVQYAAGKERQLLKRSDLLRDHPYNTYMRAGLPPGPIASPGLATIEAALEPASVMYLYFVKRDEQRHFFSTTLEGHQKAVARYRSSRTGELRDSPGDELSQESALGDR